MTFEISNTKHTSNLQESGIRVEIISICSNSKFASWCSRYHKKVKNTLEIISNVNPLIDNRAKAFLRKLEICFGMQAFLTLLITTDT